MSKLTIKTGIDIRAGVTVQFPQMHTWNKWVYLYMLSHGETKPLTLEAAQGVRHIDINLYKPMYNLLGRIGEEEAKMKVFFYFFPFLVTLIILT